MIRRDFSAVVSRTVRSMTVLDPEVNGVRMPSLIFGDGELPSRSMPIAARAARSSTSDFCRASCDRDARGVLAAPGAVQQSHSR